MPRRPQKVANKVDLRNVHEAANSGTTAWIAANAIENPAFRHIFRNSNWSICRKVFLHDTMPGRGRRR